MRNSSHQRHPLRVHWPIRIGLILILASWGAASGEASQDKAEKSLGFFKLTYYHVAQEASEPIAEKLDWPIYSADCAQIITFTTRTFHNELSLEGTGLLRDGRLVNFESRCSCARAGYKKLRTCYVVLDREAFPWGRGASLNNAFFPLRPLYSVAVDPTLIPIGTEVFLPDLAGRIGPEGTPLSGCFRAEDAGHNIKGKRLDLFTGLPTTTQWLQRNLRLDRVRVVINALRCRP